MDKEKLWRMWTLIARTLDDCPIPAKDDIVAFEVKDTGAVALLNYAGEGPDFDTIDDAIDFLDPPAYPTSDEWRALFEHDPEICGFARPDFADAVKLCQRHDRAKAARRD